MNKTIFKVGIDRFESLTLRKTIQGDNLFFLNSDGDIIDCFLIFQGKTAIHCVFTFFKSSITNEFLPRPTFFCVDLKGEKIEKKGISFKKSEVAINYWLLMDFIRGKIKIVNSTCGIA